MKAWRIHPKADGPAGMMLAVHDHFRAASTRLVALTERDHANNIGALARIFVPLAQTLHHHHHAEEAMVFPLVLRQTGTAPDHLQADHDEMTAAITHLETALIARADVDTVRSTVATFHGILIAHLDREEALDIPIFLEMTPHEAWSQIHA